MATGETLASLYDLALDIYDGVIYDKVRAPTVTVRIDSMSEHQCSLLGHDGISNSQEFYDYLRPL